MKKYLVILALFLSFTAQAQIKSEEVKASHKAFLAETAKLQATFRDYQSTFDNLSAQARSLESRISERTAGFGEAINGQSAQEALKNAQERIELEKQLAIVSAKLPAAQKQVETLRAQVSARLAKVPEGERTIASLVEREQDFQQAIITGTLETKVSDLKGLASGIQYTLNRAELKYDRTMMGLYMRAKLEDLVNSGEFCSAQNSCPAQGGPPAKSTTLEKLFRDGGPAGLGKRAGTGAGAPAKGKQ